MWKENLYQPVEILLREHDTFPIGEHQHSFFEMALYSGRYRKFCCQFRKWRGRTS